MATVASSPVTRPSAERRFYSRMALFLLVIVFIGFAPSFFLRGLVHVPRPNPTLPPSVMIHGIVFTLWVLTFFAQAQLVAVGRRDLHMRFGVAGMGLAAALIPIMYLTAVWQVARANQPPFTDPLDWTIVPLLGIPLFATLLWIGWTRRREPQWHKRAMLCAALMMADPSIGRFPIAPPTLAGHASLAVLVLACFIPLAIWDRRTIGRLHPVTKLALLLMTLMLVVRVLVLATGAWAPVAAHLPGIGG